MAYQSNPDPIIVEHRTVQPVVERTTVIERDAWYSEPWGIALVIALIAVLGIVVYFVGFNPSNTAPVVTNSTSTTRIEKDVTPSTNTTTPVIVNTPAAAPAATPPSTSSSNPPVVINNTTAPATPTDKTGDSSKSTGNSDTSGTPNSDSNSSGTKESTTGNDSSSNNGN